MDLALNNLQRLICHRPKQPNQPKPDKANLVKSNKLHKPNSSATCKKR